MLQSVCRLNDLTVRINSRYEAVHQEVDERVCGGAQGASVYAERADQLHSPSKDGDDDVLKVGKY